jgi:hypothetical protein
LSLLAVAVAVFPVVVVVLAAFVLALDWLLRQQVQVEDILVVAVLI